MAIADAGTPTQLLPSDKPSVTRRPAHADMSVVSGKPQHRIEASVLSQTFWIDPAYKIKKGLGQGAYGCVASAVHVASGESIAIKKVSNVFNKRILTKRALRELKCVYDHACFSC